MSSFVHREGVNPNSMDGEIDPSDQNDDFFINNEYECFDEI